MATILRVISEDLYQNLLSRGLVPGIGETSHVLDSNMQEPSQALISPPPPPHPVKKTTWKKFDDNFKFKK